MRERKREREKWKERKRELGEIGDRGREKRDRQRESGIGKEIF